MACCVAMPRARALRALRQLPRRGLAPHASRASRPPNASAHAASVRRHTTAAGLATREDGASDVPRRPQRMVILAHTDSHTTPDTASPTRPSLRRTGLDTQPESEASADEVLDQFVVGEEARRQEECMEEHERREELMEELVQSLKAVLGPGPVYPVLWAPCTSKGPIYPAITVVPGDIHDAAASHLKINFPFKVPNVRLHRPLARRPWLFDKELMRDVGSPDRKKRPLLAPNQWMGAYRPPAIQQARDWDNVMPPPWPLPILGDMTWEPVKEDRLLARPSPDELLECMRKAYSALL